MTYVDWTKPRLHRDLIPQKSIRQLGDQTFVAGRLVGDPTEEDEALSQKGRGAAHVLWLRHAPHHTIQAAAGEPHVHFGGGGEAGTFGWGFGALLSVLPTEFFPSAFNLEVVFPQLHLPQASVVGRHETARLGGSWMENEGPWHGEEGHGFGWQKDGRRCKKSSATDLRQQNPRQWDTQGVGHEATMGKDLWQKGPQLFGGESFCFRCPESGENLRFGKSLGTAGNRGNEVAHDVAWQVQRAVFSNSSVGGRGRKPANRTR